MDITTVCRLCATSNCELHPLFLNNNHDNAAIKIHILSQVEIHKDDGLPNMICVSCTNKLNSAYNFRLQIISTDKKFKLQFNQQLTRLNPEELIPENNRILPTVLSTNDINEKCDEKIEINNKESCDNINETKKPVKGRPCLKNKVKKIKSPKPETIICPKCGKILKKNSFTDHMLNIHSEQATIQCNVCGKMCKSRRQLWHHKRSHKKENINCDKCGKIFTTKRAFKVHYDNIHLGKKNYSCTLCEKSFAKSEVLKQHIRSHTGEKPFTCPHCSRSFNGRWAMKQHIWLHTNEKPYKCKLCPEGFAQNVTLKLHIKRKHLETVSKNEKS